MISYLKQKVNAYWREGDERSLQVRRNILYTFAIRGISVFIGYMLLPLTIHYLDNARYGLWVTIASLVSWINTFDIGLSNGLRNKLAHSIAIDDDENIHRDISTTYAILFVIATIAFSIFLVLGVFVNFNNLLRVPAALHEDLWPVILIMLGSFCIQFVLQPINSILTATHQPFITSLITLISQALTYVLIWLLSLFTRGNLYILVIIASGAPVLVLLAASLYLYSTSLRRFLPSVKNVHRNNIRALMNISGAFFFIQLGALVLYETDTIVITRVLGPESVTPFNIVFKYFSIISIITFIILTPYWSAFTDAYARGDLQWIRQSIAKMRRLWLYASVLTVFLWLISEFVYRLWIGEKVVIPNFLSLAMAGYAIAQTWMMIHAYLLNGVGKLRIQLLTVIFTGLINIPLSIWLIHTVGITGTVIANIMVTMVLNVVSTYQSQLILNDKAVGIWNK